jgi:hypothetical protein
MVLEANKSFCTWLMDSDDAQAFLEMFQAIEEEILVINTEVVGIDFNVIVES